jgi:hypothetical protein
MRSFLAVSHLATALLVAAEPAAALKKTSYPEVRVELRAEVEPESALAAMLKRFADAVERRDAGALYPLVGPTFFWTLNGEPSKEFESGRDALHNFKVAFGFRRPGARSDSRDPHEQLWETLEDFSGAALYRMNSDILCAPASGEPESEEAMDKALSLLEGPGENSEWVYSLEPITLTERPDGGATIAAAPKLALPIIATNPPTKPLGNNPLPTHYQLLLPSGKTGWVDVDAVQPLAVDKLCYGKDPGGAWKIVGYDQNN